ncbi:MAG: NlpC/P60 family protein [Veillonellales bacterium]
MHNVFRIMAVFLFLLSFTIAAQANAFQEGDRGQEVAIIQQQLNALGYNAGSADGDYGFVTQNAVKSFQRDRGLDADGVVGTQTYRALMGRDIPASRGDRSSSLARRLVQTSLYYRGVPYAFGGTTPDGFDCSGFTRYIFAQVGVYLPRAADEQYDVGRWVSYNSLQPGDLVYFSTYAPGASHVGIYLGDGQFISATSSRGVAVSSLDGGYWGPRYIGARRVL